jgi:hypothetical protein
MIFKSNILFYGDNSWTVALRETKLQWKIMDMPTSFVSIFIFLDGSFEYRRSSDYAIVPFLKVLRNPYFA